MRVTKRKFLLLTVLMLCVQSWAYEETPFLADDGYYYYFWGDEARFAGLPDDHPKVIYLNEKVTCGGYEYTLTTINNMAFSCDGVTTIILPNTVTTLYPRAFEGCSDLENITLSSNLATISSTAFMHCTKLTSIDIPNSVKFIDDAAFSGCSSLASVTLGSGIESIRDRAFEYCTSLKSVAIPDKVTTIGKYAFDHCSSLFNMTLGSNLVTIGDYAFQNCGKLTRVLDIPNHVKSIGKYAFRGCYGVEVLSLNDELETIGTSAFEGCSGLTSLTLPNSLTKLGLDAFKNCTALTSIYVGTGLTDFGHYALGGVKGLQSLVVAEGNPVLSTPNNCNTVIDKEKKVTLGCANSVIPDGVESVYLDAFMDCTGLTSIKFPSSLRQIYGSGFENCTGLTSIELPEGFTTLYYGAFMKCSGVTTITLPSTLSTMKDLSLNCKNVKSIICHIDEPFAIDKRVFSFDAIFQNARLFVPFGTIDKYKSTAGWNSFKHIIEPGDANADGVINAADIVEVAAYLNDHPNDSLEEISADADGDGVITPNDLKLIIGIIMGR